MILSKWPILETKFKKFSLNGYKHEVWYGDALAGSGIGMAKLMIGSPQHHFIGTNYKLSPDFLLIFEKGCVQLVNIDYKPAYNSVNSYI